MYNIIKCGFYQFGETFSFGERARLEGYLEAFFDDAIGAGPLVGSVDDHLLQTLDVMFVDSLREGQSTGHEQRHSNFVGVKIGVRGNDAASGEIDSFAHHFHSEQSFFLLEQLSDAPVVFLGSLQGLGRVVQGVHTVLQFEPLLYQRL